MLKLEDSESPSHCCQILPHLTSLSQRSDGNADQHVDDHNVGRDEEPDEDQLDGALEGDHRLREGVVKLQLSGHHGDHSYQRVYRTLKPEGEKYLFCDRERGCKPFASYCILLKKDVEGKGKSNEQGKQGCKKEKRLAEDGEEDVEVDGERRQVAKSEEESGPGKQDCPGREMGVHLVHHIGVTHIRAVRPRCHHENEEEEKEEVEEKAMPRHQSLVRVKGEEELFCQEREVEEDGENEHQCRGELKARLE